MMNSYAVKHARRTAQHIHRRRFDTGMAGYLDAHLFLELHILASGEEVIQQDCDAHLEKDPIYKHL